MTTERFEQEKRYQVMMTLCRSLLRQGVLSEADFAFADQFLREKYHPIFIDI